MSRRSDAAILAQLVGQQRAVGETKQARLYHGLRELLEQGVLAPGVRLPATRSLAVALSVSRNTVNAAIAQLVAEGYLIGRVGAGFDVAGLEAGVIRARPIRTRRTVPPPPRLSSFGRRTVTAGVLTRESPLDIDFRYGAPDVAPETQRLWQRHWRAVFAELSARELDYAAPGGEPTLRTALVDHLGDHRGVRCTADQIVIVNGSQQALDLTARLLLDPDEAVAIEDPQYRGAREVFLAHGAQLIPCPVDSDGMQITPRASAARLAYVTPSHQFPTGAVMSLARRQALLEWAHAGDRYIVEDDYDSEFRYVGSPIAAIQGLDPASRVIYAGTFSKILFPGLRLGYLVLPEQLVAVFARAKWLTDRHSPTVTQRVVARLMETGDYQRIMRRMRVRNERRRQALLSVLATWFGERLQIAESPSGMHILAWVPEGTEDQLADWIAAARAVGVGLYSVRPLFLEPPNRSGLLFGFAALTEAQIAEGIARVAPFF